MFIPPTPSYGYATTAGQSVFGPGSYGARGPAKIGFSRAADIAADRKFDGGFKIKRDNLCPTCFMYRSHNGVCGCPED